MRWRYLRRRLGAWSLLRKATPPDVEIPVALASAGYEMSGDELFADPHLLPATMITYTDGLKLLAYINNTRSPMAMITPAYTKLGIRPAPAMAAFSSQAPNSLVPDILTPLAW